MKHDEHAPSPEQWAAFVDGELDADTHRRVEAWRAAHPDDAAEVQGQHRLAQLWQQTAPAEPSADAWDGLLGRLHGALAPAAAATSPRTRPWLRWGLAVMATAAAVLWIAFAWRSPIPEAPRSGPGDEDGWEPLVLASRADVEIHSVAADDVPALLVGEAPLQEALVLARAGDVAVKSVEPDVDGMVPDMSGMGGQASPMIVVPLGSPPPKDAER
jgi:anti-sigma factor RsiW